MKNVDSSKERRRNPVSTERTVYIPPPTEEQITGMQSLVQRSAFQKGEARAGGSRFFAPFCPYERQA